MVETSSPILHGFLASAGLIIAIGTQNAFVLSQALSRQYNVLIASICCTADAVLITAGVLGMGLMISENSAFLLLATLGGAAFLSAYSLKALHSAFQKTSLRPEERAMPNAKVAAITTLAITLLNPHVYLDTVVLIGSIGGRYPPDQQSWFITGACLASIIWFFSLSFGARFLTPLFRAPKAWQILDLCVSAMMGILALSLWRQAAVMW